MPGGNVDEYLESEWMSILYWHHPKRGVAWRVMLDIEHYANEERNYSWAVY